MSAADEEQFTIVGVGASAGGLESLERFFSAVDPDSGMAFVVVQHLSPHFKSLMDQLLGRRTTLPIHIAATGTRVEPNCVYLLPAGKSMVLVDRQLVLTDKDPSRLSLPIDRFFESLARSAGSNAAAVVLSGTGSDGSRGVKVVRELGGVAIAESHASAQFYGMPRSAIEAGVDAVLPPEQMPAALRRVAAGKSLFEPVEATLDGLGSLLSAIQVRHDIDFSLYKPSTIQRRINRRAQIAGESFEAFVARAASEPETIDELCSDFLVNVTRFFRDESCFERLESELDRIVEQLEPEEGVRAWCVGCATGEEAYSVGIAIHEAFARADRPTRATLFATDISRAAVKKAARGAYTAEELADVAPERVERFFDAHPEGFVAKKLLRELIVFSQHDVLHDAPFTNLDLAVCRNMLIYLDREARDKALTFLHFALKSSGVLFLGTSETPGGLGTAFTAIDDRAKLFAKRDDSRLVPMPGRGRLQRRMKPYPAPAVDNSRRELSERVAVYDALCDRHLPPSVLLDEAGQVLEMFGGAERYLSLRGRRIKTDFVTLLNAERKGRVAGALRVIERDGKPLSVRTQLDVPDHGPMEAVLRFERLPLPSHSPRTLVVLEPGERIDAGEPATGEPPAEIVDDDRVATLETELARTREHLQDTVEDLETSNEELQATNEELVASNEELQSTNEELSSVNEELYTVNAQYQSNIEELRQTNADIHQLLSGSDIATLFLDEELRIRRFTPALAAVIDLTREDIGRGILSFQHRLDWDGFYDALARVARTGEAMERETKDREGRSLLARIHAYEGSKAQRMVVATLTDVSALATARAAVRESEARTQRLMNAIPVLTSYIDANERYQIVNEAYGDLWGRDPDAIVGLHVRDLLDPGAYAHVKPHMDAALRGERAQFEAGLDTPRGEMWALITYVPDFDANNDVAGFYATVVDISTQHGMSEELDAARREADAASRAKSEFLANMSHEIRTPMTAIMGYAELLDAEVTSETAQGYVDTIRQSGRHLLAIIDDVLDLSRIERGAFEAREEPFSPVELIFQVQDLFSERARSKGLALEVDFPDLLPQQVSSDPRRIRQILFNLVANAIKFTDRGSVTIRLRMRVDGMHQLVLEVVDTGIGIDESKSRAIFEPFRQLSSDEKLYEGTGLGLAICARLTELLNGHLSASGMVGVGSTFRLTLPVRVSSDAELVAPERSVPSSVPAPADSATQLHAKILLVDDSEAVRTLLQRSLSAAGAEVVALETGVAALETMKDGADIDAIIMDIQMPGIDGLETTRILRKRGYDVPIIALTARAMQADREMCIGAGCNEHMAKPIDLAALRRMLRSFIDERSKSKRVLVVDDHRDSAEMLAEALRARGVTVDVAIDVRQALDSTREKRFDVVLSDVNFGGDAAGLELAEQLRARTEDIRLIAMSGASDLCQAALDAGFDDFMVKPFPLSALDDVLRS